MPSRRYGEAVSGGLVRQVLRNGASLRGRMGRADKTLIQDTETREQIYGGVPPVPVTPKLTVEERAALIPRILELRERGLTWPMVAKEMGLRSSQIEKAFKEFKANGRCGCGEPGIWRLDPYQLETHGEEIHVFLCDTCWKGKCDEV